MVCAHGSSSDVLLCAGTRSVPPAKAELPVVQAESLFLPPGRQSRPKRLAIILRGLPGSGKSAAARKLREVEVAHGGEPPRVHSIDDYFITVSGRLSPCRGQHEAAGQLSRFAAVHPHNLPSVAGQAVRQDCPLYGAFAHGSPLSIGMKAAVGRADLPAGNAVMC